jgi:Holliday junction resolvase RusA-like endonuclease
LTDANFRSRLCRWGYSTTYMTAQGKALKEHYQWEARSQWKGKPLEGDVEPEIALYFGTKRKADWDNFHKLSGDALTGIVYHDDSQVSRDQRVLGKPELVGLRSRGAHIPP